MAPEPITEGIDFLTATLSLYMPEGRLTAWPRKFKRQYVIIEEIAKRFEPGIVYPEAEVDAMLKEIYPRDHCTLRRYLVDLRFVQRKDGVYWR